MNQAELEQLYARLEKPLYNVVYRWLWNVEDAHEAVQETFLRLWRMREKVEVERAEPLVYRIALNLAASRRRWSRLRRWVSLPSAPEAPTPEPDALGRLAGEERRVGLQRALESLEPELRNVILLCDFSEMTYDEIGELLRIAPGTVGSRRNRALKKLRSKLERGVDPGGSTRRQRV